MTTTHWHAGPELLRRYADGTLDQAAQAAVEAHVDRCAACRSDATTIASPISLGPVWAGVLREVRTPPQPAPVRLLRRLGVRETDLVVLRRSGGLLLALALSTGAALLFVMTIGQLPHSWQPSLLLLVAPLVPVVLVAGAYDSADALRELTDPTPFSKLRVALLRTVLAIVGAVPLMVLLALVPVVGVSFTAWLLPALALSSALLALLCWYSAPVSLVAVVVPWAVVVLTLRSTGTTEVVVAQVLAILVGSVALVVLARQLAVARVDR